MFCGSCGIQIKEGAKFCPNCGQPVSSSPVTQPAYTAWGTGIQQHENQNNWPLLLMISTVLYAVPQVTTFIINITQSYGIGYPYAINNVLYIASSILALCAFVNLKSIIESSIRNTLIAISVVTTIIQLYYCLQNLWRFW
jgi:hypothetical protein